MVKWCEFTELLINTMERWRITKICRQPYDVNPDLCVPRTALVFHLLSAKQRLRQRDTMYTVCSELSETTEEPTAAYVVNNIATASTGNRQRKNVCVWIIKIKKNTELASRLGWYLFFRPSHLLVNSIGWYLCWWSHFSITWLTLSRLQCLCLIDSLLT